MYSLGVRPSYKTGFAQWPGMSEYPELWKGLVGAWDMSLGQTGTKVFDLSGNGRNLTLTGDVSWTAGDLGSALDFVGDGGDYLDHPHIDLSAGFTIIGKMRFDDVASDHCLIATLEGVGGEFQIWMDNASPNHFGITIYDAGFQVAYGNTVPIANTWYVVAMTYVPDDAKLYVNGLYDGANVTGATFANTAANFRIGEGTVGNVKPHNGLIEYVMLYNHALSASEIALLYQLRKQMV